MHRYRFLLFRPLQLLPVLLGISLITFMMVRAIPGDPARILLGVRSTPAALASRRSVDSSVYDRRARIPGVLARHHADSAVQYRARLVSGLRLRQRFFRPAAPYGSAVPDRGAGAVGGIDSQPARQPADGDE